MDRLDGESLSDLAVAFDASLTELEAALASLDDGEAITRTPAWPEVVRRIQAGASLRETARRFQTTPRRIRRGLARDSVRVGGVPVGDDGVPELQAVVDELGQTPDGVLAERCGTTVEAVQGERRRRGIDAFRPTPSPQRKVARRRGAPPAPPPKAKPRKVWQQDEVDTTVVTRGARRRTPVDRTPSSGPVTGFASGLRLPAPRPASSPSQGAGERGWATPPAAPEAGSSTRRKSRRRVIRTDADPIAAALGRTSKAVEATAPAAPRRPVRRRRVARSGGVSAESPEPSSGGAASRLPLATQASETAASELSAPEAAAVETAAVETAALETAAKGASASPTPARAVSPPVEMAVPSPASTAPASSTRPAAAERSPPRPGATVPPTLPPPTLPPQSLSPQSVPAVPHAVRVVAAATVPVAVGVPKPSRQRRAPAAPSPAPRAMRAPVEVPEPAAPVGEPVRVDAAAAEPVHDHHQSGQHEPDADDHQHGDHQHEGHDH